MQGPDWTLIKTAHGADYRINKFKPSRRAGARRLAIDCEPGRETGSKLPAKPGRNQFNYEAEDI